VKLIHLVDGGYYGFPWDFSRCGPWVLGGMAEFRTARRTGILAVTEDALPVEYRDNLICATGAASVTRSASPARERRPVVDQQELIPPDRMIFAPWASRRRPTGSVLRDGLNFGRLEAAEGGRRPFYRLTWKRASRAAAKPEWYPAASGQAVSVSGEDLIAGLSHPSRMCG